MILYFSGTGNSEYVAKRISKAIKDVYINLFEKIRSHDFSEIRSDSPWIVVVPTYAWRIPRIVESWIEKTILTGNKDIYFIMTCGGSIGNAGKYLKRLCDEKGLNYMGSKAIKMPENYIAMFSTPTLENALAIIRESESVIDEIIYTIKEYEVFSETVVTYKDKINSGVINSIFYPIFVHSKKFYTTDTCVSCSKCVNVCPLNNIKLKNGKPEWGNDCTHCMACINHCPTEAIEYGNKSRNMTRYVCPIDDI